MAEAVGACALAVVAYLVARPRLDAPLWMARPVAFTMTPAAVIDIDPVRTRIRRRGDRLPIRKHDGSDRTYDDGDAFVMPPRLPDAEPEPDPSPSTEDADAVALYLDQIQARLHLALDAQYVAFCAALQVSVTAPLTVKHKAHKGKDNSHGRNTPQGRMPERDAGGARRRGRRNRRGGVRVG